MCSLGSALLCELVTVDNGIFPDIQHHLDFYNTSFDQLQAQEDGVIVPCPGVNQAYDQAVQQVTAIQQQLDDYLKEQRRKFKCKVSAICHMMCQMMSHDKSHVCHMMSDVSHNVLHTVIHVSHDVCYMVSDVSHDVYHMSDVSHDVT